MGLRLSKVDNPPASRLFSRHHREDRAELPIVPRCWPLASYQEKERLPVESEHLWVPPGSGHSRTVERVRRARDDGAELYPIRVPLYVEGPGILATVDIFEVVDEGREGDHCAAVPARARDHAIAGV